MSSSTRKVDIREEWRRIQLDPDAERDPMLADAVRATMAACAALGNEKVRGAVIVVDRTTCPRPRVPPIYVLPPEQWSAEMAAELAGKEGDVFAFVVGADGATWSRGLLLLYDGPPVLA